MEKFLGRDSKRGFLTTFELLLAPKGAAAGFLPVFFFGGWSLRRGHQQQFTTQSRDRHV